MQNEAFSSEKDLLSKAESFSIIDCNLKKSLIPQSKNHQPMFDKQLKLDTTEKNELTK